LKIRIHDLAAQEFDDAIDWYEMQSHGLGARFKSKVVEQINRIKLNPTWFPVEEGSLYKAFIPQFPYKILFTIEDDVLIIWAVAHLHRKPWYWQARAEK